jgi:hypothetical protein
MRSHRDTDERSRQIHIAVADKIRANPALVSIAKANIERLRMLASPAAASYLGEWESLLNGDLDDCLSAVVERSARGNAMRRASPFAGVLSNHERYAVLGFAEVHWGKLDELGNRALAA